MDKLVQYTKKLISMSYKQLSKPQQENMAQLIVALFYTKSFSLRDISSSMLGESNVKHKLKRLKYFLDSITINMEFWKSFVKIIYSLPYFRLRARKYITILIDATTLREDFWILAASISYRGRAIPVYLKMWKGVNEPYDYWSRVEEFIRGLKELMPVKYKYELIMDRGFQGSVMFNLCKKTGWDYVIRINNSYKIKLTDGTEYIQLDLFSEGLYEDVVLGVTQPVKNINVVINSVKSEGNGAMKWHLATSLQDKERTVNDYSRRMWIEESFKDLKSELKWELYTRKIPGKKRLENTIIISCLSYAIRLSVGSDIEVPPSEEKKTSVLKRFQQLLVSGYRKIEIIYKKVISLLNVNIYRFDHYYPKIFG
ncbi:MAG: transposase [Nitrospirae bacterium]|nr:transposase [Nitrospirota bacterium]